MRGYEDLDEYEDDGFIERSDDDDGFIEHDEEQMYEEDEGEEEEAQEVVRKPTKEEVDFLKVRQQIKETMRKQMKKENASATGNSQERKRHNYGSFFGPSQPVIAQRVIQESKSLLENPHLAARVLNPQHRVQSKKSPALAKATPRPGVRERPPKVVSMEKQKAQILKDQRDYSFLLSEDAELPAPTKLLPPRTGSAPNTDARSAQLSSKSPKSSSSTSRPALSGREQRPAVSGGHRMQSKPGQHKPSPGSRPGSTLGNHRKQLDSSIRNGPSRTQGTNGFPSKTSVQVKPSTLNKTSVPDRARAHTTDKNISLTGGKRLQTDMRKTVLPRPHPSVSGLQKPLLKPQPSRSAMQRAPSKSHPYEQRKDFREVDRSRLLPKQQVPPSTAPKVKTPKQLPPALKDRRRNRSMSPDATDVRQMVRSLMGYKPRCREDEDDSDMEVGFNQIMQEERRSARIAQEEDERERILIEQEEKEERERERMRMRKKRKLSSH
ncbi:hypothetical protein C5167_016295 [Papaver somniferum]|uniref:microtubule-associated protein 2-like isoform X1 n=1 Tax=Papaver somniferum TaxID=3469 RepID=UPI000E6F87D4|nr:microtubule-associated protein 2-like isoform X1 [Papaver somniferum]RZC88492.1 hypothetical protein C5167_016295 [Papaver somniferum]